MGTKKLLAPTHSDTKREWGVKSNCSVPASACCCLSCLLGSSTGEINQKLKLCSPSDFINHPVFLLYKMSGHLSFRNQDTTIFTKLLFDWLVLIMKEIKTFEALGKIYYQVENIFVKGLIAC